MSRARRPVVFMFSGQGSQYFGMGRDLRAEHPGFAERLEQLDGIVRRELGYSVLDILYDPTKSIEAPFDRLLHSHPAICMVELALADVVREAGVTPDYVLGTSLGELVAATVAGAIDVEDAMRAAVEQARLAEAHCPEGAMVAVLHDIALADDPAITAHSELVGTSFSEHFVVAGTREGIARIVAVLRERSVAHYLLPVLYPFHSTIMEPIGPPYRAHLGTLALRAPKIPLVSCARGAILREFDADYFWSVAREPIRFREGIAATEGLGEEPIYVDLGPSSSLAAFLGRELPAGARHRVHAIMSQFNKKTRARLERVVSGVLAARDA